MKIDLKALGIRAIVAVEPTALYLTYTLVGIVIGYFVALPVGLGFALLGMNVANAYFAAVMCGLGAAIGYYACHRAMHKETKRT